MLDLFREAPHRRWNPLKREWVIVSPNRTERPWLGQVEKVVVPVSAAYDTTCYLCPGNVRAGGNVTPPYTETYVFDNDFAALLDTSAAESMDVNGAGLLRATTERGVCRVICFSPRHDVTLATMKVQAVCGVVDVWIEQELELGSRDEIGYVQIFENRGAMMGASNPHPHGQVWATQHLPNEAATELAAQSEYFHLRGRALLSDYLALELREGERIIAENESWVAVVPFWAVWPFEVMLLPRDAVSRLGSLEESGRQGLAAMLSTLTRAYDKLFATPFPYSMGLHPAPSDGREHPGWRLHVHFYPPLLRSASLRKFMVGFELLASPQRDITPEVAAKRLRQCCC